MNDKELKRLILEQIEEALLNEEQYDDAPSHLAYIEGVFRADQTIKAAAQAFASQIIKSKAYAEAKQTKGEYAVNIPQLLYKTVFQLVYQGVNNDYRQGAAQQQAARPNAPVAPKITLPAAGKTVLPGAGKTALR
jgi:hypothetical protein